MKMMLLENVYVLQQKCFMETCGLIVSLCWITCLLYHMFNLSAAQQHSF